MVGLLGEKGYMVFNGDVYDADAVDAINGELYQGRAVQVGFYTDKANPGDDPSSFTYPNPDDNKWAQYTYDQLQASHAVTIVGWDDTYSASNFLDGNSEDGTSRTPPGDGAWIVKNSWGAADQEFPNKGTWGIDGNGYFYLSYYDKSVCEFESLDFDVTGEKSGDYLDSYAYMPLFGPVATYSYDTERMANVYTASSDFTMKSLGTQTIDPNTKVTFDVYLLGDDAASPVDGTKVATAEDTFEYGGYHTVAIDSATAPSIEEGQCYSVVVTQQVPDKQFQLVISTNINMEGASFYNSTLADEGYVTEIAAKGVINQGESYVYSNGLWKDWTREEAASEAEQSGKGAGSIETLGSFWEYDNFPIRVMGQTVDVPDTPVTPDPKDPDPITPTGGSTISGKGGVKTKSDFAKTADNADVLATTALLLCVAGATAVAGSAIVVAARRRCR